MQLFAKIANGFQLLTIFAKRPVLDFGISFEESVKKYQFYGDVISE